MTKQKPKEWLRRYLPAEIAGTISALLVAFLAKYGGYHAIIIAFAGSLGEAIGFYSTVFIKQILITRKEVHVSKKKHLGFQNYLLIIATILLEFGPAGLIDDFIIRPFFMYWFPILLNNFTVGIIAGKIAGDVCFYFLVIMSYELIKKKKKFKNNASN
jgi:hypothetical protein